MLFVINIVQLHNLPACQRPHFPLYKHEAINAYCWRYIWEKQTLIAFHWQIDPVESEGLLEETATAVLVQS